MNLWPSLKFYVQVFTLLEIQRAKARVIFLELKMALEECLCCNGHCAAFCGLKWRIWPAKLYFMKQTNEKWESNSPKSLKAIRLLIRTFLSRFLQFLRTQMARFRIFNPALLDNVKALRENRAIQRINTRMVF